MIKNIIDQATEFIPMLVVISGTSGSGKDTIIEQIKKRDPNIHFTVTATTREPRPNERHGINYYFHTLEEFQAMVERGEFLEHNLVYNQHKGTLRREVLKGLENGKDTILRVDVQGAAAIRRECPQALLIFIFADSIEKMIQRLENRQTESAEEIRLRVETALKELERLNEYDYLVINRENRLQEAVNSVLAIIEAEHHRVNPRRVDIERLRTCAS